MPAMSGAPAPAAVGSDCYKISRVVVGVMFTLCLGIITAGFQGFLPAFRNEGIMENYCIHANSSSDTSLDDDDGPQDHVPAGVHACTKQNLQLDLMFTLSMSVTNFQAFPAGMMVDRLGPRFICRMGSCLIILGWVLFATGDNNNDWMFILGYILGGSGGAFVAFAMFTLPRLYKEHSGLIFSCVVAAFSGSSFVPVIFTYINRTGGVPLQDILFVYISIPITLFLLSGWIFPEPQLCDPDVPKKEVIVLDPIDETDSSKLLDAQVKKAIVNHGWFGCPPGGEPVKLWHLPYDWKFWIITAWFSAVMTSKYYYMENCDAQIYWVLGGYANGTEGNITVAQDDSEQGAFVFSFLVPGAGLLVPIVGWAMDNVPMWGSILFVACMSTTIGIISNIPVFQVQYLTMTCVAINRFYFYALSPVLCSKMFGIRGISYYGIVIGIAALVNLSNYGWAYVSHVVLHSWLELNIALNIIAAALGVILMLFVRQWERDARKKTQVDDVKINTYEDELELTDDPMLELKGRKTIEVYE